MPHTTTPTNPSRITISPAFNTNPFPSKRHNSKRRDSHRQQQDPQTNLSTEHWRDTSDIGSPDQLLSPDDATNGSFRPRSRSRLSRLNPFSSQSRRSSVASSRDGSGDDSSTAATSPQLSPSSTFSLSRTLSRGRSPTAGGRNQQQEAPQPPGDGPGSSRSPLANPSPATRRPRARTPPPAYSAGATEASGPTLGASPAYEEAAATAAAAAAAANSSSSQSNGSRNRGRQADSGRRSRPAATSDKDPLALLSLFDTIFLIDDSQSMWGSSWEEAEAALRAIVPACTAHDEDGVDVYFLNHMSRERDEGAAAGTGYRNVRTAAGVTRLFRNLGEPEGRLTLTGVRLQRILQTYLSHYERRVGETGDATCVKPINVIVVTDGIPSDDPGDVIRTFARRLDRLHAPPYQVGIQFFQVGDDPGATDALRRLDNELKAGAGGGGDDDDKVRDMVDTVTFDAVSLGGSTPALTSDGILKTVLGAVNRRLDGEDLEERR